jgi:hypothetical protein
LRVSIDVDNRYGVPIINNACNQPVYGQAQDYAIYVTSSEQECEGLTLSMFSSPVLCHGDQNGIASVSVSGGAPPYIYSWSNQETSSEINGLAAGDYTVTVTDSDNCSSYETVQVGQPEMLTVSLNVTDEDCLGNNGAITSDVLGGTQPYAYSWSNEENTPNISGLSEGVFSVLITDNNNCSVFLESNVNYNCIESPVEQTKVSNPTCGGNVQSLNDLIYCDAIDGAANYQWRWIGGDIDVTVNRQAIYNDFKAKMVPGIQNNTTYTVYVRARTDEGWGNFGEACQVHIVGVPETKLQGDCNGMLVSNAENLIYCDAVPGAQNYEWRWVNLNDESVYVRQRNAIYNDFKPSTMLPDIEVGATYLVSVRARVNNVWGEYGDECPITMPSVGLTQVQGTWCNRSLNRLYLTIRTQSVAGATNYQWEWTNTSTNETYRRSRGNVLNDFSTRWVPDFANGQTWSVRVRARANGLWGEYGNACLIHTPPAAMWQNGGNDMASQEMEENLGEPVMKIYPNPSNGEAVRIMMHDISHDTEAIITIYDAYGRQVYSRQLTGIYAGEEVSIKRLARVVLWDVLCYSPSRV